MLLPRRLRVSAGFPGGARDMKTGPATKALSGIVVASIVLLLLGACGPSARKLDESIFYEGKYFRLKLVRDVGGIVIWAFLEEAFQR